MPAIVDEINVIFNADVSRFTSGLSQVENQMNRANNSMNSAGNSIRGLLAAVGLVAIGDQIKNFAESAIQASANLESMRVAFTSLTGNAQEANAVLTTIQEGNWGIPLQNVEDMTKGMLAVGMSGQQAVYSVNAVNDAATALGLGASGAETVSNAIDKIALTGKVSALTMRPIIAQHIDAWKMLADYLSVSVPQAEEMVKKGAVSAQEGIAALTQGMTKEYADGAAKQLDTINGMFTRMKNDITVIMSGIGDQLMKSFGFGAILKDVVDFADELKVLVASGMSVSDALNKLIPPGIKDIIEGLAYVIGTLLVGSLLQSAAALLANTLAAAPWIAAGAVLVATGILLYENWGNLGKVLVTLAVGLGTAYGVYKLLTTATQAQAVANEEAGASWLVALGPIGAGIALILGIAAAIWVANNSQAAYKDSTTQLAKGVSEGWVRLENDVTASADRLKVNISNFFVSMAESVSSFLSQLGIATGAIQNYIDQLNKASNAAATDMKKATDASTAALSLQNAAYSGASKDFGKMMSDAEATLSKGFKLPKIDIKSLLSDLGTGKGIPDMSGLGDSISNAMGKAAKGHTSAANAVNSHADATIQLSTVSEVLTAQIDGLSKNLEIWGIQNNKASTTNEYLNEQLIVLSKQQVLAAENVSALKTSLDSVAESQGKASKAFLDGSTQLINAQTNYAKLTQSVNDTKVALDNSAVTKADAYIHDITTSLEAWRIQTGNSTTSTDYLNRELGVLQDAASHTWDKMTALSKASLDVGHSQGYTSDAFYQAESKLVDADLEYQKLKASIQGVKDQLDGVASGPQWIQISANVKGLARAIDDANSKGKLQTSFTLPSSTDAQSMGQSFGANLTQGFQDGMQAHSPSLIERTLIAISDQAKQTFSDLMALGIAFTSLGSKMMSIPTLMTAPAGGGSNMTTSPTIGLPGLSGVGTAAGMTTATATGTAPGESANSPGGQSLITVQQLVVREEADLQRIARLLFRMQQNQLRPKGITP